MARLVTSSNHFYTVVFLSGVCKTEEWHAYIGYSVQKMVGLLRCE